METQSTRSTAQFEIVTDIDAFASLQQEWETLWQSAKGTPFQLFRYCLHALREVAIPTGASLHCIVGRKDGRMGTDSGCLTTVPVGLTRSWLAAERQTAVTPSIHSVSTGSPPR